MNFQILKREEKYAGRAFKVDQVTAQLPNGKVRAYDLVDHAPSVTIIPLTSDGKLLLIRQFRLGTGATLIELPAGVIDEKEAPQNGARRELREETGMDAGVLQELGAAFLVPGYCNEYMHFYLARDLVPAPLNPDEDEFMTLEAYPVAEVYRLARSGQIQDSKTLAALFLAEKELNPV
jgi:ADP-ribose pyrophosphatase